MDTTVQHLQAIGDSFPVVGGLILGVIVVQCAPPLILWRFVVKPYLEWKRQKENQ